MIAKAKFERLGFEQTVSKDYLISYEHNLDPELVVSFYINEDGSIEYDCFVTFVTLELHDAINEQINEIRLQLSNI